jgi:apolipoprotein N-acyltransferase
MGPVPPELLIVALLVTLAVAVAGGYWVYEDATRRGSDSAALWAVVVGGAFLLGLLFGIVALIAYFVVGRPDAPERTL